MLEAIFAHRRHHEKEYMADLKAWLRIPSISTDSEYAVEMAQAATWLADYMQAIGLETVELLPTPGAPVVYGEWMAPDPSAPTVLVYGHYDVQPPDPLNEWQSPPFQPTEIGDRLVARGASDDKGQVFAILMALASYLKTSGQLPINLKMMIEGEEEISSPHMAEFVSHNQDRLHADVVLICDGDIISPDQPLLMYGVRGNCYMQIEVTGPASDLHSGTFGGIIDNPFNVLVRILAGLQDGKTHKVLIPGFYDRVQPITDEERALLDQAPMTDELAVQMTGARAVAGEAGYRTVDRATVRPTFDIAGMPGGYTGPGRKTVIPAKAAAKVTMRMVPDQDPFEIGELFTKYVQELAPPTVHIEVKQLGGSYPAVIDIHHPAIQAAAAAYEAGFGKPPAYMRGGGSLPIIPMFQKTLGVPVALIGLGLTNDNVHAPNEFLHLPTYRRGIDTLIHYFHLLAT